MKPIALVTCYFHHNYGSMLQAYATEMIMQQMHLPYQTIACKAPIDYMEENKAIYIVKKLLIGDWKMRKRKRIRFLPEIGQYVMKRSICLRKNRFIFHLIARTVRS